MYNQDGAGRWWSSTFYSSNTVYNLGIISQGVYSRDSNNKVAGFPLR